MTNLEALNVLDGLINLLNGGNVEHPAIKKWFNASFQNLHDNLLQKALDELIIEKYVENNLGKYSLTFKGFVFLAEKGYKGRISNSRNEAEILEHEATRKQTLDKQLTVLTFFLAVGTIALAISEIIKLYFYFDEKGIPRASLILVFGLIVFVSIVVIVILFQMILKSLKS